MLDCWRLGALAWLCVDFGVDARERFSGSRLWRRDDRAWVVLVDLPRFTVTGFREEFSLNELKEVTAGVSDSFFFSLLLGRLDDLSFMRGREALGGLERRGEDLTIVSEFVAGRLITLLEPGITACRPWPCPLPSRLPKKRNLSLLPGTRTAWFCVRSRDLKVFPLSGAVKLSRSRSRSRSRFLSPSWLPSPE